MQAVISGPDICLRFLEIICLSKTHSAMKTLYLLRALMLSSFALLLFPTMAQEYDVLIKDGHIIDPKNNLNDIRDVAIKDGRIVKVAENISEKGASKVINAKGLYITPGIIDIHTHVFYGTKPHSYLSDGLSALPPDGFTFRVGVTTIVDVGGAGWRNFEQFKEQTIDNSKTRVLSFLNIVGSGMKGGAIEQDLADMDGKLTAMKAKQYKDLIVGIKLAHYSGPEWDPVQEAVKAGDLAGVPVMIDFGGHTPHLSFDRLLNEELRPGDILTHAYANVNGRTAVVDDNGKVRDYVFKAQKKGIIFDVGHGGGSFRYDQAIPALKQGLLPNSISTDLHTGSMNGGMKDMLNVMSKFLNMNMTLQDVIKWSTWAPAQIIHKEELGHLSEGAIADLTVLNLRKGDFGFVDVRGQRQKGDQKLECELTIKDGKIVYDLNGISY